MPSRWNVCIAYVKIVNVSEDRVLPLFDKAV
jgi:hypothetical protein